MNNYDSVTLSAQTAPIDVLQLSSHDLNDMANFAHNLDFPGEAIFNDIHENLSSLPFTPSYEFDGFSTTFDDPLAYQTSLFDTYVEENINNTESLPADLDNKLLGFGAPIHKSPVLDEAGQTWPRLTAELNGMFCVAEDVFEGDTFGRPLELTCYRRNLFQISGNITLSRTVGNVLLDQCRRTPILELVAALSATETIEGKSTEIISVPWKSGNANPSSTEDKSGSAPSTIPIDLTSNQETDPIHVSIPIAWGRLQFKYATANNGRRKGLQQHYQIQISLMARVEADGQLVKLAEIQSNPIVVRGRSPKNFDSSKDVPLTERKIESANWGRAASLANTPQWIEPALAHGSQKYHSQKSSFQPSSILPDWTASSPAAISTEHRAKKLSTASPVVQKRRPPIPLTKWSSDPQDGFQPSSTLTTTLSMDEEENGQDSKPSIPSSEKHAITSPSERVDLLYEYFPLSLDDWMPPVDAIYRPHVVHHLRVPADVKAQQVRGKPKRYFSAED